MCSKSSEARRLVHLKKKQAKLLREGKILPVEEERELNNLQYCIKRNFSGGK